MSILVVGSVAYDGIITPYDRRERTLGGSATYFSLAAQHFAPVNLVAVVGEDFDAADRAVLDQEQIDLKGLETKPGKTFYWRGEYLPKWNDRLTHETQLNVFEHFEPKVPESYRDSEVVFLGNIAPKLQMDVLDQVTKPKLVALDTMNLWINIARTELVEVLKKVDVLLINDSEASLLTEEEDLITAAAQIRRMGPRILCIKKGEHGAMLFVDDKIFIAPAYPLCKVVDPTGAGDAFAGGFVGFLANNPEPSFDNLKRAVIYGTVMGSFTVEAFSVEKCAAMTRAGIEDRYRELVEMTHFQA